MKIRIRELVEVNNKGRAVALAVLYAMAGVALTMLFFILTSVSSVVDEIRAAQIGRADTYNLLVDCTQKGGTCFKKNQKTTDGLVHDINKVAIYTAACADRPRNQTIIEIQTCVLKRIAEDDNNQKLEESE